MSFTHGRKARLYFAGLNLSLFLNNVDLEGTRDAAETSVFTDESKTFVSGQKDAKATADGVFDGSALSQDESIRTAFDGNGGDVFTYLPTGDGFGNLAICWKAEEVGYKISTPVSDAARWNLQSQVSAGTERARVLVALSALGVATNGADYDWGGAAPTIYGGAAYLHVVGTGPVGAFTVTVEHSVDGTGGSWSTVATFAAATDKTAQRVAIAAGVASLKRHTRYVVSGSTGGLKISVALARFTQ